MAENKGSPSRTVKNHEVELNPEAGMEPEAGRGNPDRPGIGALGGNAPDEPVGEDRTATIIEKRRADEPVLDETDLDYMGEYLEEYPDSGDVPRYR